VKTLVIGSPLRFFFELQVHSTVSAMRRWIKANTLCKDLPPGVFAMCVKEYPIDNEQAKIILYLSEEVGACDPEFIHECVHAADFASPHAPRGVDKMEFRAYLVTGLVDAYRCWAEAGFKDAGEELFEGAGTYMYMALNGGLTEYED
jgi:hypothetical protein